MQFTGDSGNNMFTGTSGADQFFLQQGGEDNVDGGDGNDGFYMGAALSAGDVINGGAGSDQLALQGNYNMSFAVAHLVQIETLVLMSGKDARFGDVAANLYSYTLTTLNANVAANQLLTIAASDLRAGENVTFNGSAELDGRFQFFGGKGIDTVTGGAGDDIFVFGSEGRFAVTDQINGGGGNDQLSLRGVYNTALNFNAGTMVNIETLNALSGLGVSGNPSYSYQIKTHDANLALNQTLTVSGSTLRVGESLFFDGSAETNGRFNLTGGAGFDSLIGGAQNDIITGGLTGDQLTGGGGNDTFIYRAVEDSPANLNDVISGFAAGDIIDLSQIDANSTTPLNDAFTFIGNGAFTGTVGTPAPGQLRASNIFLSNWIIQADVNGDGVSDFDISLTVSDGDPILVNDFIV